MEERKLFAVAKSVLQTTLGELNADDEVRVEPRPATLRVAYVSTRDSRNARDVTRLECRVEPSRGQLWIDGLRVASPLRHHGLGSRLVTVAEGIAASLGLRTINAFALVAARPFWEKMGYAPHPRTARVVTKALPSRDNE